MSIPYIPTNAPFNEVQRAWLNGYLAALFSNADGVPAGTAGPVLEEEPKTPLTILYGSQTGNSEGLAKQFRKAAEAQGFAVHVSELDGFERAQLPKVSNLLIVTSTYGEGDPPDNAQEFHAWLHSDEAPKLPQTRFGVLALGDTNYEDFCQTGKDFDARLEALGATRLTPRVDCETDYDEPAEAWFNTALTSLKEDEPQTPPAVDATPVGKPEQNGQAARAATFSKKHPYSSALLENRNLNKAGSAKATHHLAFALETGSLAYEVGDAFGVYPVNDRASVNEVIEATQLPADAPVPLPDGSEVSFEEALTRHLDISKLNKATLQAWAERMKHEELLRICAEPELWKEYSWGRELIDALLLCRPGFADASEFVAQLKPLAPRLYSISSSPKAHDGEVHLTVGRVRYESYGRERFGVCSRYLSGLTAGDAARVFVQANTHFRPPADPGTPLIMVGPGTGIAPFRAFLQERKAVGAKGRNWLFFGDQRSTSDFLYQEQLETFQKDGYLHRLDTAFSRDQDAKVYVQNRMIEAGRELYAWLEEGAAFYVCGDASRMAKDVDKALHEVVVEHGGKSSEAAEAYVKQMKKEKRYLRDVY
ncbi:MAG: sulfite reductase subunit alpha [Opitutales bacterium]